MLRSSSHFLSSTCNLLVIFKAVIYLIFIFIYTLFLYRSLIGCWTYLHYLAVRYLGTVSVKICIITVIIISNFYYLDLCLYYFFFKFIFISCYHRMLGKLVVSEVERIKITMCQTGKIWSTYGSQYGIKLIVCKPKLFKGLHYK